MNIIDIISLIPVLLYMIAGFRNGIIREIFGIIALFLGILSVLHLSNSVLNKITTVEELQSPYLPLVVYALVFLAVFVGLVLLGRLLEKVLKTAQLNFVNRLLGLIAGLLKATLVVSLFVWLIDKAELFDETVKAESYAYQYIKDVVPKILLIIGELIPWLKELVVNIEEYFGIIASNIDRTH